MSLSLSLFLSTLSLSLSVSVSVSVDSVSAWVRTVPVLLLHGINRKRRRFAARRHKFFFQRGRIVTLGLRACTRSSDYCTVALRFFGGPRQIDGNGQASLNTKDVFCGRFVPYTIPNKNSRYNLVRLATSRYVAPASATIKSISTGKKRTSTSQKQGWAYMI